LYRLHDGIATVHALHESETSFRQIFAMPGQDTLITIIQSKGEHPIKVIQSESIDATNSWQAQEITDLAFHIG